MKQGHIPIPPPPPPYPGDSRCYYEYGSYSGSEDEVITTSSTVLSSILITGVSSCYYALSTLGLPGKSNWTRGYQFWRQNHSLT